MKEGQNPVLASIREFLGAEFPALASSSKALVSGDRALPVCRCRMDDVLRLGKVVCDRSPANIMALWFAAVMRTIMVNE